jgi:CheY-like chemotaxis protein
MINANVLLIEDNPDDIRKFLNVLPAFGHTIVRIAETLPDALQSLDDLHSHTLDAHAILMDANLGSYKDPGADGQRILDSYARLGINIPIIGNSAELATSYGYDLRHDAHKDPMLAIEYLELLPEPAEDSPAA